VKEETGNRVEIGMPLDVRHFVRDDGQQITLIIFLCKFQDEEIVISEEHQEYTWFDIDSDKDKIPEFFQIALANYKKLKHD
jgi:8-oxo-dGTP pyrophosphatase MutT (NUDIX family)